VLQRIHGGVALKAKVLSGLYEEKGVGLAVGIVAGGAAADGDRSVNIP
jgi:hypothetical protein